jgi:hypothetical protein
MIWNSRSARLIAALFFKVALADADSMLAAGCRYSLGNASTRGDLPMMIPGLLGSLPPLSRVRTSALEQFVVFNSTSGDIRWAVVTLTLCLFTTLMVSGQEQLRLISALLTLRWQQGVARVVHRLKKSGAPA